MSELNVLGLYGSLRRQSTNMKLLRYAQANAPAGMRITIADLSEVPFYNADYAERPSVVQQLCAQAQQADALHCPRRPRLADQAG